MEVTIGIDIGGTSTKYGIINAKGEVLYQKKMPTQEHDTFEDFVKVLSKNLKEGLEGITGQAELIGVGIGAPNANYHKGTIETATNLKWKGVIPVTDMIKQYFDVPVVITNDANAAAVGEMVFGGAKNMKDFIVITLGTGLGSGFIANGELINGKHGIAGELGHTLVNPMGRYCNCGKRGCLETYASATGIRRTVYKLLADHLEPSVLRGISFDNLNTKMITEAALNDDPVAKECFEYTGKILGTKLSDTVVHTDPEAIFIMGGLAQSGSLIIDPIKKHIEANLMPLFKGRVKVLPSELENQTAPILGAGSLVWKYLEKNPLKTA